MRLATAFPAGYDLTVAAKSANGIGVPETTGGHAASRAVFLCPKHGKPSNGRAVRWPFGAPVSCRPVRQLRTVPLSLIGVGEADSITATTGQFAMTYRNPLSSSSRARAHRAMARTSLFSDSSLAVRLRKYRKHMNAARRLEGQEVRK